MLPSLRVATSLTATVLASAAAQAADAIGVWEGRWQSEVKHNVEGDGVPKQLFHEGSMDARFQFCVAQDGTVEGAGTAKVMRNASAELKRVESNGDRTNCTYAFSPTSVEVPLKIIGQVRGEDFWLFLAPDNVDMKIDATCHYRPVNFPPWSNSYSQSAPTAGHGILLPTQGNPLITGFTIAARDGADQQTEGFDTYPAGWEVVPGLAEYRNRVQIRRPRDAAHELPVLLGQVFPSHSYSADDPAEAYPSGERKLESVLPDLKAALDGSSGKPRCGRPKVTVVIEKGPNDDDLFLEALNRARRDKLRNWFAERGIDTSQIDWETALGREDDVQVSFGGGAAPTRD